MPYDGPAYVASENAIYRDALSDDGFVLRPFQLSSVTPAVGKIRERLVLDKAEVVAAIPNIKEFSEGPDFFGHGFIVKSKGSDQVVVPREIKPFLPVIQVALNHQYETLGPELARDRYLAIRISRHTGVEGAAHQPHFAHRHNHRAQGESDFYLSSDKYGTQFDGWTAPDGVVTHMQEHHDHFSPVINGNRRTLAFVMSHKNDPDPRGRVRMHLHPMTGNAFAALPEDVKKSKIASWLEAGSQALQHSYPPERQLQDVVAWRNRAPQGQLNA